MSYNQTNETGRSKIITVTQGKNQIVLGDVQTIKLTGEGYKRNVYHDGAGQCTWHRNPNARS